MIFIDDQTFTATHTHTPIYSIRCNKNVIRAKNGKLSPYNIKFARVQLTASVFSNLNQLRKKTDTYLRRNV